MNKEAFRGTKKVFQFTFSNFFKSKGSVAFLVICAVISLLAVPLVTIFSGGVQKTSDIENVFVLNQTDYSLSFETDDPYWGSTSFSPADFSDYNENIGQNDAFARIYLDDQSGALMVVINIHSQSSLSHNDLPSLEGHLSSLVETARLHDSGISPSQTAIAMAPYSVSVKDYSHYIETAGADMGAKIAVQGFYAILIMMVSVFSATYIIQAVIEEKSSRLVELLMISIKPLALISGKILAVMAYFMALLGSSAALFGLSYLLSGFFLDLAPINTMLASAGLTSDLLNLGPGLILVFAISMALAYLTFSIMAGISGVRFSSISQAQSASMGVTLVIMAGYLLAFILPMFESRGLMIGASLFPVVSAFCAPVQYMLGTIDLWVLLLSWVIQGVVAFVLANLCARVYSALIIYNGNVISIKALLGLFKSKEGGVKTNG